MREETLEACAKAGYEAMIKSYGFNVAQHTWESQMPATRQDWREAAKAIIAAYLKAEGK